jgi:hypothetical protein
MAKDANPQSPATEKSRDEQFRAVVKRLLDTPPMHKPGPKGKRPVKCAPERAEKEPRERS